MEYTEIRGLPISKITLGTVALGKTYGISNVAGKPTVKQSSGILATAFQYGINTLDTANDYGNAEQIIGNFLQANSLEIKPVVTTKFKITKELLTNKSRAREEAFSSLRSSLKSLKIERVPVCLYHQAPEVSSDQLMEVLPDIFLEMQREGLIDVAGISVYHPEDLKIFSGNDLFQAFQLPMNVFDHRLIHIGLLDRMFEEKKMIFIRSVFLQGLFFMSADTLPPNLQAAATYLNGLNDIALAEGISVAELAFSFVRDIKGVTSIVFGAVTADQVIQNAELLKVPSLSERAKNSIRQLVADIPEQIIIPGKW